MGGYDPYSSNKCAELVTAAYRSSFFHTASYQERGSAFFCARVT
jgi:CDP-glucose 4,6-dehydratase